MFQQLVWVGKPVFTRRAFVLVSFVHCTCMCPEATVYLVNLWAMLASILPLSMLDFGCGWCGWCAHCFLYSEIILKYLQNMLKNRAGKISTKYQQNINKISIKYQQNTLIDFESVYPTGYGIQQQKSLLFNRC